MYTFTNETSTVHANHNWEEWHAYVNDTSEAPAYVDGNSSGVCCHDCRVIMVWSV